MDRQKILPMAKAVLVLAAIALASGLLLGFFNILTYVDPLQSAYDRFSEDTGATFSEMTDSKGQKYENGSVKYYALSDDGEYHAFLASGVGWGGELQLYVYIRDDAIAKVVLGENGETLWGQFEDSFFNQFVGMDVSKYVSFGEADVQTGATAKKTIRAVADAINAVITYYNANAAGGESNGQG